MHGRDEQVHREEDTQDLSPHYGLQLGRANAVLRRLHRMILLGHSVDDDDEGPGADDNLTL